jgi:phosphate ABC transporter phosphate-binding protein
VQQRRESAAGSRNGEGEGDCRSRGAGDFGAGEAPLTEKQRKDGSLTELLVVLIGIVLIYNLPDLHGELRLSGDVLADIFLGDVKTWSAPQIAKLNPDVTLPNLAIKVINRPAGKGSNYVFTDFLSKVNPKFRSEVGVNPSPKWPVGKAAERSSDVADKVKGIPGSIGYVEYQYAVKANIPQAAVLNPAGRFVKASMETIAAACDAAEEPRWNNFSASLTNVPGAESYPITSFTWIYLRTTAPDAARATGSDLRRSKDTPHCPHNCSQRHARKPRSCNRPRRIPSEVLLRFTTPADARGKHSHSRGKKPVPNLSVAIGTGFTQFRTASTGSAPNLFHRTAVFAAPLRYSRTETKI